MIWILLFLFGLTFSAVYITDPLAGRVVDSSSYTFRAGASWVSAVGDTTSYPSPLSCSYTIAHGGGTISGSTSAVWNCYINDAGTPSNTSDDYRVCSASINIPVSGLQQGLGGWQIDCGIHGSSSTGSISGCSWATPTSCILYDFEDPVITLAEPSGDYPGPDIPLQYTAEDDNPQMICKVYLDAFASPLFEHRLNMNKIRTFTEILQNLEWGSHTLLINCSDITREFPYPTRYEEKWVTFRRWVPDTVQIHLLDPDNGFTTNDLITNPVKIKFWVNDSPTEYVDCQIKLTRTTDTTDLSYTINNVPNTTDPGSKQIITYELPDTLQDGRYEWYVECMDQGPLNVGTSDTRVFWIDREDPYRLDMIPADGSGVSDLPLELRYRVYDAISPSLDCDLTSDFGVADSRTVNNGEWATITVTSITEGTHTWSVSCVDVAGNSISETNTFVYTDVLPPSISLIRPAPGQTYPPGPVQFRFSVSDGGSYSCDLMLAPEGGTFSTINTLSGSGSQTFTISYSITTEGNYEWKVVCRDSSGNEGESTVNYFGVFAFTGDESSLVGGAICGAQPFHSQLRDVTALLLVLGVAVAVMGILFGNLFNIPRIVMTSKAEIKSLIITGAIFGILLAATSSLCGFLEDRMLNGWANFSALIDKLEQPTHLAAMIYGKSVYISGLSSPQYQMNIPYVDITYKKNIQKVPFDYMQDVKGILDLLMGMAGGLSFYDRFVSYLVMFSMQVLMYLGLMLRMTPFTRRYGTTILALSISLIFLLPLLYETTANLLYRLTSDSIVTITGALSYAHGIIDKYFTTLYYGIKDLKDAANIFNILHIVWAIFHIIALIFLRFAQLFPPALPAAIAQVYGVSSIIYQAFLALAGFVWTAILTNVLSVMGGAVNDVPELYDAVLGVFQHLAFINLITIFFYVVNLLVILGATRAISLLGGGDYFLYGVEDHI